jgi:hypothetical protein
MINIGVFDASIVCCAVLAHLYYRYRQKAGLPYPPGPKPLPLIGNALDIPTVKGFEVFAEWSKTYGMSSSHENVDGISYPSKALISCILALSASISWSSIPSMLPMSCVASAPQSTQADLT